MSPIFLVVAQTGSYEDYQERILGYSPIRAKAETLARLAQEEADVLHKKSAKIWAGITDKSDGEAVQQAYKEANKIRSGSDPELSRFELGDVNYVVEEVAEIL